MAGDTEPKRDSGSSDGAVAMDVEAAAPKKGKPGMKREQSFASLGMRITFKDLDYSVESNVEKGKRAFLLSKVSGWFEPNEMAALMGPSGSGKTTLLDLLAGRKNAGKIEGTVLYAGQKATPQFLRRYTGYVEQFDTLIPSLTVYEMLLYTAELKRSIKEPLASKKEAVEELLDKLALQVCRDVPIGDALTKGISGGQAKRTNIGIALITNPRVLFLDEPTSGLDSYTSNEVMTVVKNLVGDGTTICATIHSPTSYCFSLFDRLIMLVRGNVVYFGSNKSRAAVDFARSVCASVKDYVEGYNDAEYLVDLVTEADRKGFADKLAEHYANSELKASNDQKLIGYIETGREEVPEHVAKELAVRRATVTPWWWGLVTLMKYRTLKNYKDGNFLGPRVGDKIMISLLIMTLYLGIGDEFGNPDNYINISAVLFMWCTLPAFGAAAYVPSLVLERNLFTRERNDGIYLTVTYLLYKLIEELFLACMATLPVAAWTYYGIQLKGEWVTFWLVYYITLSNGIILAYLVAAISPNMDVANALLPTYVVTLLFFAGFLFRYSDMPPWWKWYSYIDFLRYAWGGLMVNQWNDYDPVWLEGRSVLQVYGLKHVNKWTYVGYESLFFIAFFILCLVAMTFKKYVSR